MSGMLVVQYTPYSTFFNFFAAQATTTWTGALGGLSGQQLPPVQATVSLRPET